MSFTPLFDKRPVENLIGLVNQQNNKGYVEADLAIKAPVVVEATEQGNTTSVDIDLLNAPSEVDGDWVTFFYTRMGLADVFNLVAAASKNVFREVDIALGEDGMPVDLDAFRAEILRKFGFLVTAEDYDISLKQAGVILVTAKATNLAYSGAFELNVIDSLATRVANTTLAGFTQANSEHYVPA